MKRLVLRLSFAAAFACGASAFASTFSVAGSGNKFIVTRDDASAAETVRYRTVALSAYPGQHLTEKSGTLTFAAGQKAVTNTVTARTPSADAYKFQIGTSRSYRFEITDVGGFPITNAVRDIATGTSVLSSGAFNVKDVTIRSAEYTADDRGYDNNGYKSVASSSYFNNAAPKEYYSFIGAQLRMTLSMQAKENDDAYEYLQLLFDNTSACDNRSGANNGDPGTPSLSSYMAGFEMDTGSTDGTYRNYTFPVTTVGNDAGATNPWGHSSDGKYPLSNQKFNTATSSRATDGRIVVPLDFSSIVLRLNASGKSGSDEWAAKSVVAHIQAVDSSHPYKLAVSVAPGIRARGNDLYVSVAFSEPVTCSSATLSTTWGKLSYNSGNGSNVLTFKGTISDAASGSLGITNRSGTVKDLAGNLLNGSLNQTSLATLDASHAYAISCDLAGGSASNPTTYTYDSDDITLANPTRTGYVFDGWSGTGFSGLTNAVTIPARSHGDRAYTAHWTPVTYTVHFDPNGGTGTPMPDQTFTYDVATNLAANAFARTGYTFDGWDYAGATYPDGAAVQNLTNENATVTLSAHWTPVAYAITYANATNGVGGVVNANPTSYTIEDGTVYLANPTRTNYFFCGWYGNPDFTGSSVSSFSAADLGERTFYAKWIPVPWNGNGTDDDPYIISTREDLDALAACVNANSVGCRNAYYRLDADIAYDPAVTNAYTPIGNLSFPFSGIFDGNGHTISGISISRPDSGYQGLFGYLCGTVRNLTLADSSIEGQFYIGGIAGRFGSGSIQNCFVIGTTLSGDGTIGAIAGSRGGTLSGNAYHGCAAVVEGSTSASGIGTGNTGDSLDDVWPCYALALAEGVVTHAAPQFSFPVYGTNNSYYAVGQSVTVRGAAGYALANVRVNGSDATDNGNGTFSFAMPAADATVTADVEALPAIPYIDAGGEPQACTNYTVIAGAAAGVTYGENGAEAWYAVTNAVTISGRLYFSGTAHLILCDGATLTVTNDNGEAIYANRDLAIYGQTNGTGTIGANGRSFCISAGVGAVTINGGSVTATGGSFGISAGTSVTVNGGSVTANGDNVGISGGFGPVTINGGSVTATGGISGIGAAEGSFTINGGSATANGDQYGIYTSGYITLGWTNPADSIYASSYYSQSGPVTVNGTLTDGDIAYSGSIDVSDLAGKTLRPAMPAIPYLDADGVERQRYLYTVLTSADADVTYDEYGAENWYVVTNAVTVDGNLLFTDDCAHLIVCDGATLTVTNMNGETIVALGNLVLYGQANGTGALVATGSGYGIGGYFVTINGGSVTANGGADGISATGLTINGGSVTAIGGDDGIVAHGYAVTINGGSVTANGGRIGILSDTDAVTINGGSVTATGDDGGDGIVASAVTINGGNVTATGDGYGICAKGNITLGWSDPSDSIFVSDNYSDTGTVSVKAGQFLTDGMAVYRGAVDPDDIAGKTLVPYTTPWKSLQARLNGGGRVTLPEDATAEEDDATLVVTNAVTLDLNGHTIDADGRFRVIEIRAGGDLALTNGVEGTGAVTGGSDDYGGGVYVGSNAVFRLQGGAIAGNAATNVGSTGGGVYVDGGTFSMTGGTVSENSVTGGKYGDVYPSGGGVYVIGGVFTMNGGTIFQNEISTSTGYGGGVYVGDGVFTMTGGTIFHSAACQGGGVYVTGSTFEISGGEISGNTAYGNGGGVYASKCAFTISGGEISGNTAYGNGGGVYASKCAFTISGGEISGNEVQLDGHTLGGGGVYVTGSSNSDCSTFTMTGGEISGNVVYASGSIDVYGGGGVYVNEYGTFAMTGGSIFSNSVQSSGRAYGGGVCLNRNRGTSTMTGGTIAGNFVDTTVDGGSIYAAGGGIFVNRCAFTMSGGEISGNWSSKNGGGVAVNGMGNEFAMTGGEISGNTAKCLGSRNAYGGGGVYVNNGATFAMTNSAISGNTAGNGGGVYVDNGTFKVSGVSVVSGNTNSVGAAANVYLPSGKEIAVDGLSGDASIGVTTATRPTATSSVTFADGAAEGDAAYFFSDNPAYSVDTDEYGELCLVLSDPVAEPTPVATTWDFVVSEGWTAIGDPFTGETNALGRTWTLAGCRVDPAGEAGGDTGCLSLQSPGSAAVAPAFRGVVTQVTTLFRPVTAGSTREVSLLASVDGGATFSVVTNVAVPVRQNYENTFVFDVPLDGGDLGVVFCASNSGTAGTVQLRRLTIEGTSTAPEEPGLHDWSPFGDVPAGQPIGALSGVVLFLDPGLGYAADPATNAWTTGAGLANGVVADFGNLDQMNFLARQAWKAGATIVPLRPLGYQTNEVVVDNADAARVTFGGAWANAVTNRHYGRAGDVGYRWTYACPTGATAWASYRPDIPGAGEYPVYAWAPAGPDRVPQLYRVRHAGGVTDVRVDHRRVGDGWVWLGSFRFAEGTAGCVNVSNYAPGCGESSIVVADAIRFGNGMGDVARGAAGVSGLERELEASRYWIERQALDSQGFPASVYDGAGTDRADADLAPARMAEHMGRMDDGPAWSSILVALDDMAMDATTLKSLRGREALARDMLRDVVHDLAAFRDDDPAAATLPPDAPVAVAATNAGYGRATVSWRMPASKVSDPHTGFVVYASTDGYAFGNPVAVASAADEGSHTFDGLPAGEPYFFRVCAVNAGGESLPSPVAGVGLSFDGSAATVLLVDGFHRADAGLTPVRRYDRVAGADVPVDVPLVRPRMINSFDYVKEHGNAIAAAGHSFDSMDSTLVTATDLAGRPFVDWFVGRESVETETLSYDEQRLLATHLATDGALFVSGSDIGRDLGLMGSASDRAFLSDILHCVAVSGDGGTGVVVGRSGTPFKGLAFEFNYTNVLDDVYAAGRAETFAPAGNGFAAATYGGTNGTEAAIVAHYSSADSIKTRRTVVAGVPFETIADESQRNKLMAKILDFFKADPANPVWLGDTDYTTGFGGTVEIALKTQVSGNPSPAVTLLRATHPNGDEADPSLYTLTVDRFVFTAPDEEGEYKFTFHFENAAGFNDRDVSIIVGAPSAWRPIPDILVDLGATTNVDLRDYVSGSPAPAIALDQDRTAADPGTYAFDPATGILSLGPSDAPVTNAFVFVASNSSGTKSVAFKVVIRRLDTDGDGIPDWWATEHFGGPTACPNPNLDPDGDGYSNLEEYECLTSPLDRYSQPLPDYLDDADPDVVTNYVDWAYLHGPDRDGTQEAPFLLDVAPADLPACTGALLRISAFVPTAAGVRLELASDLPGHSLFQPASLEGTAYLCNGILVLETASDLSALTNAPANLRAAPATIEGGAAVIDLPASDVPALFLRPSIRSVAPAP